MQAGEYAFELGDRVPVAGHAREDAHMVAEADEPHFLGATAAFVNSANQQIPSLRIPGGNSRE